MFRAPSRSRAPVARRLTRLTLEALETRDCPAAPALTLTAEMLPDQLVHLSGVVTDEQPQATLVQFMGAVKGVAAPDAAGNYSAVVPADSIGTVTAIASDVESLTSDPAEAGLTSNPPVIVNFTATPDGPYRWIFSGEVIDEAACGLTVLLSGPGNFSATAVVGEDGRFCYVATFTGTPPESVCAQTWDWWGLESEIVERPLW